MLHNNVKNKTFTTNSILKYTFLMLLVIILYILFYFSVFLRFFHALVFDHPLHAKVLNLRDLTNFHTLFLLLELFSIYPTFGFYITFMKNIPLLFLSTIFQVLFVEHFFPYHIHFDTNLLPTFISVLTFFYRKPFVIFCKIFFKKNNSF